MAKPCPVLLISRELGTGGTARDVCNIARGLDRARFEPHVACFNCEGIRAEELRSAEVPIVQFPVRSFVSLSLIGNVVGVGQYLRQHNIRLLHAFDAPADIFAVLVARTFCIPVITANLWYRQLMSPIYRHVLRVSDLFADAIVVNSDAVRRHLVEDEKVPSGLIHLCYSGIDTQVFVPERTSTSATLTIGSVCVLRPEKRIDMLLEAFARVRHLQPGIRLLIGGSGEMLGALQDQCRCLGLQQDCSFQPEQKDVVGWMQAMDIFVMPSSSESFPNALLEAMGCGCCVIASRVGGIPELVSDRFNGLLFEQGDIEGLVTALALAVREKSVRERLGHAASRAAHECFSLTRTVCRIAEIYDLVLGDTG
jgi:glycosyltransferase involved in cell wall biosynthesis